MLARLLLLGRGIPTLLEPDPLCRILADDLLHDRSHLHCELMQITIAVPRVRTAHDLADDDLVPAARLSQDKCRHYRRFEFTREDGRSERSRCRTPEEFDECAAGTAVLIREKTEEPPAL